MYKYFLSFIVAYYFRVYLIETLNNQNGFTKMLSINIIPLNIIHINYFISMNLVYFD